MFGKICYDATWYKFDNISKFLFEKTPIYLKMAVSWQVKSSRVRIFSLFCDMKGFDKFKS